MVRPCATADNPVGFRVDRWNLFRARPLCAGVADTLRPFLGKVRCQRPPGSLAMFAAMPLPLVPLLIAESEEEFNRIRQASYDEIKPVGIIECMYVDEIVDIVWQILRLKRAKLPSPIWHFTMPRRLSFSASCTLDQMFRKSPSRSRRGWPSTNWMGLSLSWKPSKRRPMNSRASKRLLISLETRRDKALVRIAHCRGELGAMVQTALSHRQRLRHTDQNSIK